MKIWRINVISHIGCEATCIRTNTYESRGLPIYPRNGRTIRIQQFLVYTPKTLLCKVSTHCIPYIHVGLWQRHLLVISWRCWMPGASFITMFICVRNKNQFSYVCYWWTQTFHYSGSLICLLNVKVMGIGGLRISGGSFHFVLFIFVTKCQSQSR